ncbi:hypothetical protein [Pyxidicoccus trucidator]|uniref:hypothetical protein n=1 Tax=Pyxidicoccus trucidator TaxID=2709662 RepID=UPI0013DB65A2|nr:hypothetical protein [Pyxidicoccus trucidator]
MSRLIWSMGGTGLVLADLTAAWLHRPLEPLTRDEPVLLARKARPPPFPPERLASGEVVASWVVLRPDTP